GHGSRLRKLCIDLGAEEQARQSPRAHERVAYGWDVILLPLVLHEHGLTEQVPEGHAQDARQLGEHVDTRRLPATRFDLRQPIGAPADQAGQDLLRVAATLAVERDPLADAEVISETTHCVLPPTACEGLVSRYRAGCGAR